jgi:hypothetical protein
VGPGHGQDVLEKNLLCFPGYEPRTVQPVAFYLYSHNEAYDVKSRAESYSMYVEYSGYRTEKFRLLQKLLVHNAAVWLHSCTDRAADSAV